MVSLLLQETLDGWSKVASVAERGHLAPQEGLDLLEIGLRLNPHTECLHGFISNDCFVDLRCCLSEEIELALLLVPKA